MEFGLTFHKVPCPQIGFICETAFPENRRISTHYLADDATNTLVVSLILPSIDYGNSALTVSLSPWSANFRESKTVQPVLLPVHLHMFTLLQCSDIFTGCLSYKTACLCFNAITYSTPAYLSDLKHPYSPSRSKPSGADTHFLKISLYKCKTKGDRAFSYFGPSVWDALPLLVRNATTNHTFKSALKTHLFNPKQSD